MIKPSSRHIAIREWLARLIAIATTILAVLTATACGKDVTGPSLDALCGRPTPSMFRLITQNGAKRDTAPEWTINHFEQPYHLRDSVFIDGFPALAGASFTNNACITYLDSIVYHANPGYTIVGAIGRNF